MIERMLAMRAVLGLERQAHLDAQTRRRVRHLEGDSDVLTGSAEFEVDTRWVITLSSQVELREGDALDQELQIERIGHTAVLRLRFQYDPGGEDFSVSMGVDLLEKFLRKREKDRFEYRRFVTWN